MGRAWSLLYCDAGVIPVQGLDLSGTTLEILGCSQVPVTGWLLLTCPPCCVLSEVSSGLGSLVALCLATPHVSRAGVWPAAPSVSCHVTRPDSASAHASALRPLLSPFFLRPTWTGRAFCPLCFSSWGKIRLCCHRVTEDRWPTVSYVCEEDSRLS